MARDGQYRLLHASISTSRRIRGVQGKTVKGDKWWRIGCHLLYTWMIASEDDDRRLPGDPVWIMANVVRYEDLSISEISEMLAELDRVKLILWYEVQGDKFIQIIEKKGDDRQRIRKDRYKESIYPPPPVELLERYQIEEEKNRIDSNGCEIEKKWQPTDNQLTTKCQPDGQILTTQSSSSSSSLSSFSSLEEGTPKPIDNQNASLNGSPTFFFQCEYFRIATEYHETLKKEFPLIDFERLFKRLRDYVADNSKKYKRTGRGYLKNPRSVIRNWCEMEVVKKDDPIHRSGDQPPVDPLERRLWLAEKRLRPNRDQTSN